MLLDCNECGTQISDTTADCPHCGSPRKSSQPPPAEHPQQKITEEKKSRARLWPILMFLSLLSLSYYAVTWTPEPLWNCESSSTERQARRIASSNQGVVKFDIIEFRNARTMSSQPDRLICEADIVLGNNAETVLHYTFTRNRDGVVITTRLARRF